MSRQAKATGWPPIGHTRSHTGRPISAVARSLALVAALFLLPACSGSFGTAMAGLFGAGAMYGGQAFLNREKDDVEAKILHRADRKKIVDAATASKRRQCEQLRDSILEFVCWKDLLAFHDSQRPETLVMELRRRAAAPEPKLIERSGG